MQLTGPDDARLFRVLLESAPDAIVLVDGAGRIVLANERVEELFQHRPQELAGQPVELLVPEARRDVHRAHRAVFAAHPHRRPMGLGLDLTARRRDGTEVAVDITLSPVETSAGRLVMAVIRDMTQQRLTIDRLRWLADHDAMTGLLYRVALDAELQRQVAESRRYGGGGCCSSSTTSSRATTSTATARGTTCCAASPPRCARGCGRRTCSRAPGGDEFVSILPRADRAEAARWATPWPVPSAPWAARRPSGHGERRPRPHRRARRPVDLLSAADVAMYAVRCSSVTASRREPAHRSSTTRAP